MCSLGPIGGFAGCFFRIQLTDMLSALLSIKCVIVTRLQHHDRVLVHSIDLLYWDDVMFQWRVCLYTFLSIEYLQSYFGQTMGFLKHLLNFVLRLPSATVARWQVPDVFHTLCNFVLWVIFQKTDCYFC